MRRIPRTEKTETSSLQPILDRSVKAEISNHSKGVPLLEPTRFASSTFLFFAPHTAITQIDMAVIRAGFSFWEDVIVSLENGSRQRLGMTVP